MRRILSRQQDDGDSEINLTPMLDVVFIMLIFFIVTATFIKEVGLDVNSPDPNKQPPPPDPDKKSIVVKITNRDRILIAQRDVDWRSVRANIERLHAEDPEAPVIIVPHRESTTGALIHIMDSARQAGVYDVKLGSMATE
ncbi:MAG TPA: biopolymer transporter ExbD [Pseudomonadales bacterium]|nr:biopolymer transporter ExbD [Pseudomonadales bacterium]